jgi:2-polyprenyl-6-hydroxyphenyl methylase/3-demethylubiquinone-9 3-methyltransferase
MTHEHHARGQVTGLLSAFLEDRRNALVAQLIRDDSRVLDLGCGRAPLLQQLHRRQKRRVQYVGIDVLESVITANAHRFPDAQFLQLGIEDLAAAPRQLAGQRFDYITLIALVEHLDEPAGPLRALSGLLAPRGVIVVTAPRRGTEQLYKLGGRLGLFSRSAADEHQHGHPDAPWFRRLARAAGLQMTTYQRFLFGFNQLVTFSVPQP